MSAERTITVKPKEWLAVQIIDQLEAIVAEGEDALWKIAVAMGHSVGWANQTVKDRRLNGVVEILDHLGYDVEIKAVKRA